MNGVENSLAESVIKKWNKGPVKKQWTYQVNAQLTSLKAKSFFLKYDQDFFYEEHKKGRNTQRKRGQKTLQKFEKKNVLRQMGALFCEPLTPL